MLHEAGDHGRLGPVTVAFGEGDEVEAARAAQIAKALTLGAPPTVAAYRWGPEAARSAALVLAASTGAPLPGGLEAELARGANTRLPIQASDLMEAGLEPGPGLGAALKSAEDAWIASGFSLDKQALLTHALK